MAIPSQRHFVASAVDAPQIRIAGEENFPATVVEGIRNFRWYVTAL